MKKNLFLMIAVLAASPVMGQDAKQIADSLSIPPVKAGAKQLPMPSVSGAQIKLLGADYEQLVNSKGKIAPVISDTPVNVSFKVTKDGKEAVSKDYEIMLQAPQAAQGNPKPRIIPEILQWKGGQGEYKLGNTVTIACPDKELGKLFAADMEDVLGKKVKLGRPRGEGGYFPFPVEGRAIWAGKDTGSRLPGTASALVRRLPPACFGARAPCCRCSARRPAACPAARPWIFRATSSAGSCLMSRARLTPSVT